MHAKPKNLSEALSELENLADCTGANFHKLKPKLDELKDRVQDEAKRAKATLEHQVKENPWATIGLVGLIFFVLGCLFGSRKSD